MARDAPSIDAYGEGGFRLAGERHEGSVLILNDEARPWDVARIDQLTPAALQPVDFALDVGELPFVLQPFQGSDRGLGVQHRGSRFRRDRGQPTGLLST